MNRFLGCLSAMVAVHIATFAEAGLTKMEEFEGLAESVCPEEFLAAKNSMIQPGVASFLPIEGTATGISPWEAVWEVGVEVVTNDIVKTNPTYQHSQLLGAIHVIGRSMEFVVPGAAAEQVSSGVWPSSEFVAVHTSMKKLADCAMGQMDGEMKSHAKKEVEKTACVSRMVSEFIGTYQELSKSSKTLEEKITLLEAEMANAKQELADEFGCVWES
ncbi:hypothetical protein ACFMBG_04260 [Leisingera sp. D0M16]|uniref:hypothetical protein n=1 Tax=Leisingera coralii TaxID=3351347 RepID=UPI003B77344D